MTSPEPVQGSAGAAAVLVSAARLRAAKDHAGAVRQLAECLATHPGRLDLRMELVSALHASGQVEEARAASEPLETLGADEPTWRRLLTLYRSVGDRTRVQTVTETFLKHSPDHEDALATLMVILTEQKRNKEVEEIIESLAARPTLHAQTWSNLSYSYMMLGRFDDTVAAATSCLDLDPTNFGVRSRMANALHQLGARAALKEQLPELAKGMGKDPKRMASVAEVASWVGETDLASEVLSGALASPGIGDEDRLRLARVQFRMGSEADLRSNIVNIDVAKLGVPSLKEALRLMNEAVAAFGPDKDYCRFGISAGNSIFYLVRASSTLSRWMRFLEVELVKAQRPPAFNMSAPRPVWRRLLGL